MGRREDNHLPIVAAHIADRLGRPLRRIEPAKHGASHDLETADDLAPSIAIEIKELVPFEFLETAEQVRRDAGLDSGTLAMRWSVLVTEEPLSTRLEPMPRFPDDPDGDHPWNDDDFRLVTKAEREAEWTLRHTLTRRPQVRIKGLASDILPHLATLERFRIDQTRCYQLPTTTESDFQMANQAVWAIKRRTNDAICVAHAPFAGQKPGIDLTFGHGSSRTGSADTVAARVQLWLDSDGSANLGASLHRSGADEAHGALWLSTDAEADSAAAQGDRFCPTQALVLPDAVDALWIFIGPLALNYDGRWTAAAWRDLPRSESP